MKSTYLTFRTNNPLFSYYPLVLLILGPGSSCWFEGSGGSGFRGRRGKWETRGDVKGARRGWRRG
ncbi:hypothetical protein PUN28_007396 [Cardiocondyla obscurior]|uniref:Uncharacterized protein n=1 Tax=Cardiocondyla obscurior TaxID=286306 RepID=A0AAW2G541_9HYME